ncbi:MAG: PQQ-like beta-propeller repeat protein, partial [Planctomycetes bacterium]|nr:PQQ-like beta-propeller repeat protein [Planctomycetota bacterium]
SGWNGNAVVALRTAGDDRLQEQGLERLVWQTPTPYPAVGAVTLVDDLVLIGCGNANYTYMAADPKGAVLALDRATGAVRWQVELSNSVLGPIASRNGRAVCAVLDGHIVMFDLREQGRKLWQKRPRDRSLLKAGVALTDDCVYAATHDGHLLVLDAADGDVLEQYDLNTADDPGRWGLSTSSPFLIGGRLYVGSETGGLRCFVGQEIR